MKKLFLFAMLLAVFCRSAYAQLNESYQWGNVAIGAGGFVTGIITSKTERDLMYIRTDVGGAYRWDNSGKKWIPLTDWLSAEQTGLLGIEALAIDPQAPNKLYMLAGIDYFHNGKSAILKSEDYGETFEVIDVTSQFKAHGNGMGRQNGERLAVDPNNGNILYCGTRRNGLFKSTNAGATWTRMNSLNVTSTPNDNGICFVLADKGNAQGNNPSQNLIVGVSTKNGANLYRSTDAGNSFSAITGGPSGQMPQRAVPDGQGNLYITYADGAGPHYAPNELMETGSVWKYNFSSGNWTNITPSNITAAFGGISIDPQNPQRILISTINKWNNQDNGQAHGDLIFVSTNGGSSWSNKSILIDVNGCDWIKGKSIHWAGSIEFNPFNTKEAWAVSGNGVFRTENIDASTTTWKFMPQGLEETVPLDIVSIPGGPMVSVIGDFDGFVHHDPRTYSPIHKPNTGTTTGLAYAAGNTNILLRVGNDMYYTLNQGASWTKTNAQNGQKGKVAISSDGNVFLHCPENSGTTYRTTDRGNSWTQVQGLSFANAKPVADPVNKDVFYAYDRLTGNFYRSTNGGVSFTQLTKLSDWGTPVIRTVPGYEGHIWFPLTWNGLHRSTNGGQTVTKINSVSQCSAVGLGKAAPGKTYPTVYIWGVVNGITGIFRSIDEGATWERINDDPHQYGGIGNGEFVIGDMNVFGRVYMSTAGRGIVLGDQLDCNNEPGGTAVIDACEVCSGGSTGIPVATDPDDCLVSSFNHKVAATFEFYPNPFSQQLAVTLKRTSDYRLMDMHGQIVESGRAEGKVHLGRQLRPGMYLLKVTNEQEDIAVKVTKF